jgi:hypothetical protein
VELRLVISADRLLQRLVGLAGLDREVAIDATVDRSADEDTASSIPGPGAVFPALL